MINDLGWSDLVTYCYAVENCADNLSQGEFDYRLSAFDRDGDGVPRIWEDRDRDGRPGLGHDHGDGALGGEQQPALEERVHVADGDRLELAPVVEGAEIEIHLRLILK